MKPEELKKIRKQLDLTQVEMAEKLGVSERFWCYRESGELPIPSWLALATKKLKEKMILEKSRKQ